MYSVLSSASSAIGKPHVVVLLKKKLDSTLCSLVQIYMFLQLPGENFLQAEIGVVFPLSTGPIFSVKSNCHNCQEC